MLASPAARRQADAFQHLLEIASGVTTSGRHRTSDPGLLELATLAVALRPGRAEPTAAFRAGLRARLLAEGVPGPREEAAPARRRPSRRPAAAPVRVSQVVPALRTRGHLAAALTASAVVVSAGAAAASSRAIPGDSLYPVKRTLEQVQLQLAVDDKSRGGELLSQADHRLEETRGLLADRRPSKSQQMQDTLSQLEGSTERGTRLLLRAYREQHQPETLRELSTFVLRQQRELQALRDALPADLQARVDAVLLKLSAVSEQVDDLMDSCGPDCTELGHEVAPVSSGTSPTPTTAPSRTASPPAVGPTGQPATPTPGTSPEATATPGATPGTAEPASGDPAAGGSGGTSGSSADGSGTQQTPDGTSSNGSNGSIGSAVAPSPDAGSPGPGHPAPGGVGEGPDTGAEPTSPPSGTGEPSDGGPTNVPSPPATAEPSTPTSEPSEGTAAAGPSAAATEETRSSIAEQSPGQGGLSSAEAEASAQPTPSTTPADLTPQTWLLP